MFHVVSSEHLGNTVENKPYIRTNKVVFTLSGRGRGASLSHFFGQSYIEQKI